MTGAKSRGKSSRSASIWARAAHDLRQPVQAMLLQLPALDRPSSQAERRRAVGQIETALLSLRDMLETLALLARIETGLQDVALRTFPLDEALAEVAKQSAKASWGRDVEFPNSNARVLVRSHPALLTLAIKSLLLNAVTLGSGGKISADCRQRGEHVAFEVNFRGGLIDAGSDKSAFVMLEGAGPAGKAADGEQQVVELGLGLDLLERLCVHLDHRLEARSKDDVARTLAIAVPLAAAR